MVLLNFNSLISDWIYNLLIPVNKEGMAVSSVLNSELLMIFMNSASFVLVKSFFISFGKL